MKISKDSSSKQPNTTKTKLCKLWQTVRHKISSSKSGDKPRAFRDSILAAKPCYSTPTPIYEFYRSRRPATLHASALLNVPASRSHSEVKVPAHSNEMSERNAEIETQVEDYARAGSDLESDTQSEPDYERNPTMVSSQFSFRSRESLSLRSIRQPAKLTLAQHYIAYHPFARDPLSPVLTRPDVRPNSTRPNSTRPNSARSNSSRLNSARPNCANEAPSPEKEIARLSRVNELQQDTIDNLSHQLSVSRRRVAQLQQDKWPNQWRWKNRKTLLGRWWFYERD